MTGDPRPNFYDPRSKSRAAASGEAKRGEPGPSPAWQLRNVISPEYPSMAHDHVFMETITRYSFDTFSYTVVYLPVEFHARLPLDRHPRLRVQASVNGHALEGCWMPAGGRWYLMLSKAFLRRANLEVGDEVKVSFTIADQNAVTVPEELEAALAEDGPAREKWDALTPGKQRGLCHMVASANRPETRARRVREVIDSLFPLRFPGGRRGDR